MAPKGIRQTTTGCMKPLGGIKANVRDLGVEDLDFLENYKKKKRKDDRGPDDMIQIPKDANHFIHRYGKATKERTRAT